MESDNDKPVLTDISKTEVAKFTESFEVFNKIINNLQRQYLSLEKEYAAQEQHLEEINFRLRQTIESDRAATSFLNAILTSLTSGVIAIDRRGVVSHFNPAAEKITGISASSALGRHYGEIFAAGGFKPSALATVMSGVESDAEEKTIVCAEGRDIPLSVSTSLLLNDDGSCYGAVEIFFDLTKTKKLENEISRVKTLAALGEMAATVAHEVRNPLGGIGGFAALLRRELEGDEAKCRLVDKIITGVNTLNMTVTALLDYTRKEQLNMRDMSLPDLIEDSVEYDRADARESAANIQFEIEVPDHDLKIRCDPHLMRQVLLNLLRNSREAMNGQGRIKIRAFPVGPEENCAVPIPAIRIEVEDTGEGIAPDIQDKIFRPFFSTRRQGSGLGLASAWKTVQAHGGDITVSSAVGQGAIFKITLPGER